MVKKSVCILALLAAAGALGLASCGDTSGVNTTNAKQEEITDKAALAVPFPKITRFQELKTLSKLYEIRDGSFQTYTYMETRQGDLYKVCNSYNVPA
jgi:hypothetical protein